jgi:hypothetical protein
MAPKSVSSRVVRLIPPAGVFDTHVQTAPLVSPPLGIAAPTFRWSVASIVVLSSHAHGLPLGRVAAPPAGPEAAGALAVGEPAAGAEADEAGGTALDVAEAGV